MIGDDGGDDVRAYGDGDDSYGDCAIVAHVGGDDSGRWALDDNDGGDDEYGDNGVYDAEDYVNGSDDCAEDYGDDDGDDQYGVDDGGNDGGGGGDGDYESGDDEATADGEEGFFECPGYGS